MKLIKQIAESMEGNLREARNHIGTAYRLKDSDPQSAAWYKDMASAHINFNTAGHTAIAKLITDYKETPDYKNRADYYAGMLDVWNAKHADIVRETAEIQAMITTFK